MEYVLTLLKPDAVESGIGEEVLGRMVDAARGRVRTAQVLQMTPELVGAHYPHVVGKAFYPSIERYMLRSPVLAAVLEGTEGAIRRIREVLGATDPRLAARGTIRQRFGRVEDGDMFTVAHASEDQKSAWQEISRFFSEAHIRQHIPEIADRVFGQHL